MCDDNRLEWRSTSENFNIHVDLGLLCYHSKPSQLDPMFDLKRRWQVGKPQWKYLFAVFVLIFFLFAFPPSSTKWFICLMTLEWRWQVGKPQPKSVPAARDSQTRRLSGSAFSSQENRNFVLLFLGSNIFPWIGSLICNLLSCYLRVG